MFHLFVKVLLLHYKLLLTFCIKRDVIHFGYPYNYALSYALAVLGLYSLFKFLLYSSPSLIAFLIYTLLSFLEVHVLSSIYYSHVLTCYVTFYKILIKSLAIATFA